MIDPIAGINNQIERHRVSIEDLIVMRDDLVANPEKYASVIEQAIRVFEHTAWSWLCLPNIRLDDQTPLEAIRDGKIARVEQLIGAIEYGVYL